jgi:dihydrofolate synthase / folylpolyglutamate synthase
MKKKNPKTALKPKEFTQKNGRTMTYAEALDFIDQRVPAFHLQGKKAYKADLGNISALEEFFGEPHSKIKTIHIAGTNGKGSVSHMLSAIFTAAGYKTGLYTSPHLISLRERIRINGKPITEESLVQYVEQVALEVDHIAPSFFELMTSMAFWYFEQEHCDIAIIETGLGGRLDATNVITPELSIITNIGLEHTDLLGDTLQKIATEKAGIIKHNVPVIIGEHNAETDAVFEKIATSRKAPLTFVPNEMYIVKAKKTAQGGQQVFIEAKHSSNPGWIQLDLEGTYQQHNVVTAIQAIVQMRNRGWKIGIHEMHEGLSNVTKISGLMGRWQKIFQNPDIICDTAHNAHGLQWVSRQAIALHKKMHIIIGMVSDKNIQEAIQMLPSGATYYFTQASTPRALPAGELSDIARIEHRLGVAYAKPEEAIKAARLQASKDDLILITGSNFLIGDYLKLFETD